MRLLPLALALLCAALASGCGGDDEEAAAPARPEAPPATVPADTERAQARRESPERRAPSREDDGGERTRTATAEEAERPEPPDGEEQGDRRRSSRAELRRFLEAAKLTVRRAVRLIGASDPSVCRRYFTQRYAERVSGLRGEAAFDRCERDIARSEGGLRFRAFGPSRIENTRAVVKFNLEVGGQTTAEEWRLVLVDGDWLVDES